MGCQQLHKSLHKKGLSMVSATPKEVHDGGYKYFEYDVLANHLITILRHAVDQRHWKDGVADIDEAMMAAARSIKKDIDSTMKDILRSSSESPAVLFLHVDGLPSLAKKQEQQKRMERKDIAKTKLAADIRSFMAKGKNAPTKLRERIEEQVSKALQLTQEHKSALSMAFEDLGLQSHVCHAETDPCIASKCRGHQHSPPDEKMAVISKDSDLIVYEHVDAVLRRNPKDNGYVLYEKQRVLEVLGLRHPKFLVMYGIGLKNDYNHNVKTIGPVGNLELVHAVQAVLLPLEPPASISATRKGKNVESSITVHIATGGKHARDLLGDTVRSSRKRPKAATVQDSMSSSQRSPSTSAALAIEDILELWCEKASNKIKMNVYPTRFQYALQTFGYCSQLAVGEDPSLLPLYLLPESPPKGPFPEDEDVPVESTKHMDPDDLARQVYDLISQYAAIKVGVARDQVGSAYAYDPPSQKT